MNRYCHCALFVAISMMSSSTAMGQEDETPRTELELEQREAEAQQAIAEANLARMTAEASAANLRFGAIEPQTTIDGTVTVKGSASPFALGQMVAAFADVSTTIAAAATADQPIVLVTGVADLNMSDLLLFEHNVAQFATKFDAAKRKAEDLLGRTGATARSPGVGAIFNTAATIASYFRANYDVGDLTVSQPDELLLSCVAASLRARSIRVYVPRLYPVLDLGAVQVVLDPLQVTRADLVALAGQLETHEATSRKQKKEAVADELKAVAKELKDLIAAYDAFEGALVAPVAAGAEPLLVRVVRQSTMKRSLFDTDAKGVSTLKAGLHLLSVQDTSAAQYYSKKSFWPSFNGPPVYTAAATAVSYQLFQTDGQVLKAGTAVSVAAFDKIGDQVASGRGCQ